jgi:predicted RNase H-like HicB family nuclease
MIAGERMAEVTIRLKVIALKEGGYLATSPDVPGLIAEGRTIAESSEIARDVARKIAESCMQHGDPLPKALRPLARRKSNGKASVQLLVPVGVS